jgi:DNA modification methylase
MNFLHTEIGSSKDNLNIPVHNWYKFTAGFSHKFVNEIIKLENLKKRRNSEIFDPFAGCGTTLVSSQKEGIAAIGNEGQAFMYEVIKAKLNWGIESTQYRIYLEYLKVVASENYETFSVQTIAHPLLTSLYRTTNLSQLYLLKVAIEQIDKEKYRLFFRLALSQTLHKVSIHPIAIPYIVRTKKLRNRRAALDVFLEICESMYLDTLSLPNKAVTSTIYRQDSRKPNRFIADNQCNVCITSPPYLNNLDYGEISKVHTHFFGLTNTWSDVTERVRTKLVTGATTHYNDSEFALDEFLKSDFSIQNSNLMPDLVQKAIQIKQVARAKSGKKSFDILMLLYFQDMSLVLSEIKRVLKRSGSAYLILGDSAPYGNYVPTTKIIGKIAKNIGFNNYRIHKIRSRGTKWKSLKHRHSLPLTENVLVLK